MKPVDYIGANETEACNQCREDADAALDVALEEAARVVREKSKELDGDPWNSGYNAALEDADAAIRGMNGKD